VLNAFCAAIVATKLLCKGGRPHNIEVSGCNWLHQTLLNFTSLNLIFLIEINELNQLSLLIKSHHRTIFTAFPKNLKGATLGVELQDLVYLGGSDRWEEKSTYQSTARFVRAATAGAT
jgi:hypothetical protein